MTNDERYELLGQLQEAEHRMRLAKERGHGHAYKDAKKWRNKIKLKFEAERREQALAAADRMTKGANQ